MVASYTAAVCSSNNWHSAPGPMLIATRGTRRQQSGPSESIAAHRWCSTTIPVSRSSTTSVTDPTGKLTTGQPLICASIATPGTPSDALVMTVTSTPPRTSTRCRRGDRARVTDSTRGRLRHSVARRWREAVRPRDTRCALVPARRSSASMSTASSGCFCATSDRRIRRAAHRQGRRARRGGAPTPRRDRRSRTVQDCERSESSTQGRGIRVVPSRLASSALITTAASNRRAIVRQYTRRAPCHARSGMPRMRCHTSRP